MANYTKATNFTVKDTLTSGDPNKIVKGTEIDTEFIAISSAIASKADLASPAFTGVPTAPTAISTTNTAQIATTAYVKSVITDLNLGNLSLQNKNAVDITGGTIAGTAISGGTLTGASITGGTISGLTSPLPVASGGTGASSFTANQLLVGNGTGPIQTMPAGGLGLGFSGETWIDVTGSRGTGVTYTNTYGKPIAIIVQVGAQTNGIYIYINGTLVIRHWYDVNGGAGQIGYSSGMVIIPPGSTYMAANGPLRLWWELR